MLPNLGRSLAAIVDPGVALAHAPAPAPP